MASKKISQLTTGSINPPLSAVVPIVYSGETFQQELSTLRETLVDSGSHQFTGDQTFIGNVTVVGGNTTITGSLNVSGNITGDGSQLTNLPGGITQPYIELTNNPLLDEFEFSKTNYGNDVDIIDEENNIAITRGNNQSIYNPLLESEYGSESPLGTLWNSDGWDNLENIEERFYTTFVDSLNNAVGNMVFDTELIMFIPSSNRYFKFNFTQWTSGNNGGGFSYVRTEIDINKLNVGIKFSDGTIQKTAVIKTPVVSTAHNTWRIEQSVGSNNVAVDKFIVDEEFSGITTVNPYSDRPWDVYTLPAENQDIYDSVLSGNIFWKLFINDSVYDIYAYVSTEFGTEYLIFYNETNNEIPYTSGDFFTIKRGSGGDPVIWFRENRPNFRGAIIDYHAYIDDTTNSGGGTIIGTIQISRDSGINTISHSESKSGTSTINENADLWYRTNSERNIYFRMLNGDNSRLRIHWSSKLFFGEDYYD
jgi:hypothetical protein